MSELPSERKSTDGRLLPSQPCPVCNYKFDSASPADGTPGQAAVGDFTVCLGCGEIFIFDENLKIRAPTLQELNEVQKDKKQWNLLTDAQQFIREKRPLAKKLGIEPKVLESIDGETLQKYKEIIPIEICVIDALTLLGTLQLALRHPQFKHKPSGKWAKEFAQELEKSILKIAPKLQFICDAGWNSKFDRP